MSKCSIKNDTEVGMYIHHSIHWPALVPVIGIAASIATLGFASAAAAAGTAAAEGVVEGGAAAAAAEATTLFEGGAVAAGEAAATAGTFLYLTSSGWSLVSGLTLGSFALLGHILGLTPSATELLEKELAATEKGHDVIVKTNKTIMEIVEKNSVKDLVKATNATENQIKKIKKVIKDHKHHASTFTKPGHTYHFTAGMKSIWKVHVINENLEEEVKSVWTAFWWGKTKKYNASTLFGKLSKSKTKILIHKQ